MIDHPETLTGFAVRAVDGPIGVVSDASADALLVRRRWRLRTHRIIPARAVTRIDAADRVVWLDRTRRQVARIPQPKGSGRSAWFVPASNRLPSGNPVIGAEPRPDEPSS